MVEEAKRVFLLLFQITTKGGFHYFQNFMIEFIHGYIRRKTAANMVNKV